MILIAAHLCLLGGLVALASGAVCSFKDKCLAFKPNNFANGTTSVLEFVPARTNITLTGKDPSCPGYGQVISKDMCRVAMHIPTSGRTTLVLETWLPAAWNGRLVAIGNGGIDGCIYYNNLNYYASLGFAVTSTNNGHNGTSGAEMLNNDESVIDFSYRALHIGVESSKSISKAFFAARSLRSYYLGCSLGGRQGIQAADKYPDDFDGIVAGAPAVDFNNLYSWRQHFQSVTGTPDSPNFINATTWKTLIHGEILRQCDHLDGAQDGIIEDPMLCKFDPGKIRCGSKPSENLRCLNDAQVQIVRDIFSPYTLNNGSLIYPQMNIGSELGSADGFYNGRIWPISQDWFRYVIYNDPNWNGSSYTTKDAVAAFEKNPGDVATWPSTLHNFEAKGGKLLVYHGLADIQISSWNTPRFYEHLAKGMGYRPRQFDEFFRFFRISGLYHCFNGPGAWQVGQWSTASEAPYDRKSHVLAALVDWVEQGIAPDMLLGTKFVNDTEALGIQFQRRHCRWPMRNTYVGNGRDPKDPDSWECREILY